MPVGGNGGRRAIELHAQGLKRCTDCREVKPFSEFYMRGGGKYTTAKCCKCHKAHYQANVDHVREMRRKQRIGAPPGTYNLLVEMFGEVCAICGSEVSRGTAYGKSNQLSIDHDKESGLIRGLLCNPCNVGIGMLQHNPALLMSAINYLSRIGHSVEELQTLLQKSEEVVPGKPKPRSVPVP